MRKYTAKKPRPLQWYEKSLCQMNLPLSEDLISRLNTHLIFTVSHLRSFSEDELDSMINIKESDLVPIVRSLASEGLTLKTVNPRYVEHRKQDIIFRNYAAKYSRLIALMRQSGHPFNEALLWLKLDTRTYNPLKHAQKFYLRDLLELQVYDLLMLRNFGKVRLRDLTDRLEHFLMNGYPNILGQGLE